LRRRAVPLMHAPPEAPDMHAEAPTVFCPYCNAKGQVQPVLSPMKVTFVEAGKPETVQPFAAAHFTYACPRCSMAEIHERVVGAA
jgi:hypothetical protein